jgi:signal transduction histidine kinase
MQLTVLPSIMGHGGQLEQVILNLLRNAVEALCSVTDRPRVLRIQTERLADDKVSIVVEDTGPGVDPQLPGKIFETFVTTKSSGMGLGLYLSRMIIQRHGGDISVSSTGVGAQFRIVLPLRP